MIMIHSLTIVGGVQNFGALVGDHFDGANFYKLPRISGKSLTKQTFLHPTVVRSRLIWIIRVLDCTVIFSGIQYSTGYWS